MRPTWSLSVPEERLEGSALAVLRRLAGLLETGLLTLGRASVAGQQTGLLERRTVGVEVDRVEATRHTEAEGAGLAGDATAVDARDDVEPVVQPEGRERLVDDLLVELVREVRLQRAAVDPPDAGARDDPDAGDGLLATAGGRAGGDRGRAGVDGGGRRGGLAGVGDALVVGLEGLLDLGAPGAVGAVGALGV